MIAGLRCGLLPTECLGSEPTSSNGRLVPLTEWFFGRDDAKFVPECAPLHNLCCYSEEVCGERGLQSELRHGAQPKE